MPKKLYKHAFSAGLGQRAPTKTITKPDGTAVTLVALPILPAAPFWTTDARSGIEFSHEVLQLIDDYRARGRRIPLDINHNTEKPDAQDTRSRGWSVDLTCDALEPGLGLVPGVLYGWFELTPVGAQELADQLYGYTSGVALGFWRAENKVMFTRIKSLALTNNPATEMPMAFGTEEADEEDDVQSPDPVYTEQTTLNAEDAMLEKLLSMLGLAADTDEATATAALSALQAKTEVADQVAAGAFTATETFSAVQTEAVTFKAQVDELTVQLSTVQTELTAAKDQVATLTKQVFDRECEDAVTAAIAARKITPAQRNSMLAFARADLTEFRKSMDEASEVVSAGKQSGEPAADNFGLTAEQLSMCKANRIDPAIYAKNLQTLSK